MKKFPLPPSTFTLSERQFNILFKNSVQKWLSWYQLSANVLKYTHYRVYSMEVLWSIWGSYKAIWSFSLKNAKWHSVAWPNAMTTSIDHPLYQSVTFLPNLTFYWEISIENLRRMKHAYWGHLLIRTPDPVPFLDLHMFNLSWPSLFPHDRVTLEYQYPSDCFTWH